MGVADRVRRHQFGKDRKGDDSHPDSGEDGKTLARVDNPTAQRVKGVLYAMRTVIETNAPSSSMSKMAYIILPALADEMCAEMEDLDEMTIRVIMAQIGEVIAWIGHGDNSRLPESLQEFAEGVQPTPLPPADDEAAVDEVPDDMVVEAEIVE